MKASDRLAQSRKQSASWANRRVGERQVAALKRNWTHGLADQPARRDARNLGPLRLIESDKSAVASGRRRAASGSPDAARRRKARARTPGLATSIAIASASALSRYSTASAKANG